MPCPHNEITIVQRSQRQSAVAAAAYQSGVKLFCEYDQQVKHYPEKRGMENGLHPTLARGSLSSPVCGSLTEASPCGISVGCAAVQGDRGKSSFDYGLRKGCDTA